MITDWAPRRELRLISSEKRRWVFASILFSGDSAWTLSVHKLPLSMWIVNITNGCEQEAEKQRRSTSVKKRQRKGFGGGATGLEQTQEEMQHSRWIEPSRAEKSKAPNQYCWQESKWLECGRNVSKVFSSFFSSLSSKISRRRHLNHRGGYSKNLPFTPPSFPDVRHKRSWPSYYLYAGNIRGKPRGTKNTKPPHIQGCHLRSSVNKCRTANNDKF